MEPNQTSPISRRSMLRQTACGFGALGLSTVLAEESGLFEKNDPIHSLKARASHFRARAKRVIFLFMHGGPSHIDTFDPKQRLIQDHGKPIPFKLSLQFAPESHGGLMKSPFDFRRYGQSGIPVSDFVKNVGTHADDLCIIRSLVGEGVDHGAALLQLNTGTLNFNRPSIGSWLFYGLGSENQNLPGYIEIKPSFYHGGARNWNSSFLPGMYQATPIGNDRLKVDDVKGTPIEHLLSKGITSEQQRYELEMLQKMNQRHKHLSEYDPQLEARIQAFELAFRMQVEAPEVFNIEEESKATKELYGLDNKVTYDYGWQLLLARRLVERGVRVIRCWHSYKWDQHSDLARLHNQNAQEVDKPIAGLLKDLKARGLLEETLVVWGGEFGRTPFAENDGRDHNPYGYTMWMAGGGVTAGTIYGATDDFGYHAVKDRMHIHDLHATILHLLGLDHTKLTYRYGGRDFRLTDVHGVVAKKIIS